MLWILSLDLVLYLTTFYIYQNYVWKKPFFKIILMVALLIYTSEAEMSRVNDL